MQLPLRVNSHKRTYKQFAADNGMVYFGYVDQRNDEHSLVRGLTVSTKHRDHHYCIGSRQGYDITIVERTDMIDFPGKPAKSHSWIIMTFDLHKAHDMPHAFLGLHTHSEAFYSQFFTKFTHFGKVQFDDQLQYDPVFLHKYSLFAKPDQAHSVERVFNHHASEKIAASFGSLTVEVYEGVLYIYAEQNHPTTAALDAMLLNGLWLAGHIDQLDDIEHFASLQPKTPID